MRPRQRYRCRCWTPAIVPAFEVVDGTPAGRQRRRPRQP